MKSLSFIPALRFHWLTKLYDPLIQITLPEKRFKQDLITQMGIQNDFQILDFGCGTATLSMMIKSQYPSTFVTGVDVDRKVLSIAKKKLQSLSYTIPLDDYDGIRLPYADHTFDRVVSSLVFHHLDPVQKSKAFREIKRVLKPQGQLHIADWGKAENALMRNLFYIIQWLDGFKTTQDNVEGLIPSYMIETGFSEVTVMKDYSTAFGTLELFYARK